MSLPGWLERPKHVISVACLAGKFPHWPKVIISETIAVTDNADPYESQLFRNTKLKNNAEHRKKSLANNFFG